jgi:hypothetical protein
MNTVMEIIQTEKATAIKNSKGKKNNVLKDKDKNSMHSNK